MWIRTFLALRQARFWHAERWPDQRSDGGVCQMGIRSHAFERMRPCAACLVIRLYGSCGLIGAQKNGLRLLRSHPDGLVRPQGPARARSFVRRHADISGTGGTAPRLPPLRQGEAGTARLSGGQSALHQALCLLSGGAAGARRSRRWRRNWRWTGTRSRRWTSNTWKPSSSVRARLVRR